jgi:type I restriction enzyme R subunit
MVPPAPQKSLSGAITTEGGLIEKPGLELLEVLGWQHFNLMKEEPGPANPTGRLSFRELVLPARLRSALAKLNSSLPAEALQQAELALTANRSAMLPVPANRDVHLLLREGVSVQVRQPDGSFKPERVAVIDWTNPVANEFLLGSQFWIESDLYKRRPARYKHRIVFGVCSAVSAPPRSVGGEGRPADPARGSLKVL